VCVCLIGSHSLHFSVNLKNSDLYLSVIRALERCVLTSSKEELIYSL